MKFRTTNCSDGDRIELQASLRATEVECVSNGVLAVLHDTDATQVTYERRIQRDSNPRHANLDIPDDVVIIDLRGDRVDYLVEVSEE